MGEHHLRRRHCSIGLSMRSFDGCVFPDQRQNTKDLQLLRGGAAMTDFCVKTSSHQ